MHGFRKTSRCASVSLGTAPGPQDRVPFRNSTHARSSPCLLAFATIIRIRAAAGAIVLFLALAPTGLGQVGQVPFGPAAFDDFFDEMIPPLTDQERQRLSSIPISAREERQLGQRAIELMLRSLEQQKISVVRKGTEVEYLRALIRVIQPQLKQAKRYRDWSVYLVDAPATEARCFPGGHLVFYRGLLDLVENEAALVGVVAHELSHLERGHMLLHLRAWKDAQDRLTQARNGFPPQEMFRDAMRLARVLGRPFRPEDEAEADRDAVTWTFRAGYDPREFPRLFLRLRQHPVRAALPLPRFLQSHPIPAERHRDTLQLAKTLLAEDPQAPCYVGQLNLQQRIPRDRKRFPEAD